VPTPGWYGFLAATDDNLLVLTTPYENPVRTCTIS
jgi:hypothetical protein